MSKKLTILFECSDCGNSSQRWLGRCPQCGAWNSFKEVKEPAKAQDQRPTQTKITASSKALTDVSTVENHRSSSGISEFDRVLGGGWSDGSAILLGGEPGIGKSTLMSHAASLFASRNKKILYINGEESQTQIKLRFLRLQLPTENIHVLETGSVHAIEEAIIELEPELCIVDSVQTIFDTRLEGLTGSTQQIKFASSALIEACKSRDIILVLIAHVTKEGIIAGPKMLEHMVDTVLYFEEAESDIRLLRATKNRHGATDELGIFRMTERGLEEIFDLRSLTGEGRLGASPEGIVQAVVYEGTRTLPIELQALVVPNKGSSPRLYSEKVDQRRVSRIAAILEKHAGLVLSDQDLYVHIAGGLKINDPALDLSIAMALYSSRAGKPIPQDFCFIGELTLAGEVRNTHNLKKRLSSAYDLGMKRVFAPRTKDAEGGKYDAVQNIREVIRACFS